MPPRRGGAEKPPGTLPRGEIGPWGGRTQTLGWVPGHQCGTRGQAVLITSPVGFPLIYFSLSWEEPWGSCLRDEGRWEEG